MFWWLWIVWLFLLFFLFILPLGYGGRRWGRPRPYLGRYGRRGAVGPVATGAPTTDAAYDGGWGCWANLLWAVLVVLIIWLIVGLIA